MDITVYLSDILLATAKDDVVFEEANIQYVEALRAGTLLKAGAQDGELAPAAKGDTVVAVLIDRRLVLDEAGRVMRARDFTVGTKYPMVIVKTGVTLNKAKLVYLDKSTIEDGDVEVLKGLGIVAI
jgi:hypothetical protein